jgi:lipopolysaccharide assembly outer membrane protein LptD (OstA)
MMPIILFIKCTFSSIEIPLRKFVKFFDKLKINRYKLNHNQILNIIVFTLFFVNVINFQTKAQTTDSKKVQKDNSLQAADTIPQTDSLRIIMPADSLGIDLADSILGLLPADTMAMDSIPPIPVGDIKTTVNYKSSDSLTINMITRDVKMYGKANIDYSPISITAEEITVNWQDNLMMAEGKVDSTSKKYGTPIFVNGQETYETDEIRYNFKTEKAAIKGLVTTQGEGFIHADQVFKNAKGELFNKTTLYTTCNMAHPHYSIKARKVKVIPGQEMISGPFNMIVNDVPLPLGFVYGIFPDQQQRNSGIIFPTFGEETRRGFYLRQGGYYFAINDYINLELTGDIYTRGGWAVRASSVYNKRYSFRGNVLFNFTKLKTEDTNTLETIESNDFRFSWSHTPVSKGTGRFSASVDLASSTYSDNNLLPDANDQAKTNLSSSINYSKTFTGTPISLGISARFNQNLSTKLANIQLPDLSLNVQNIYPFKKQGSSGSAWYEKIVFRYSMSASNKITNRVATADGFEIVELNSETLPGLIKQGSNGLNHQIPISTSLSVLKHLKLNPSFNYQERWYFKKLDYTYNDETQNIDTDTINGFNAVRSYQASVGLTSIAYGTIFFNREFGVQAIRHQLIPSISYSYKPDFGDPKFDYFQEVQYDSLGNTRTLSRYAGFVYGQPGQGESSSIGLSLTNTLEMKFMNRNDTTGKAEKIVLLRNFGLSTGYNFAADSFKLSPISINASTNLLKNKPIGKSATTTGFNINFRGTIDPYLYVLDSITGEGDSEIVYQRKLNQFAFNNGQGLGQFSTFNISISTGFRAKTKGSAQDSRGAGSIESIQTTNQKEEQELQEIMTNPDLYVDFKIPWSIRFSYNVNYSRVGFREGKVTQSLKFNGDLSLTQKWKMTFNSGYDFERNKFNETRLGITRDLHCWEMRLDWVPYGRYQSYNFTIKAKSSLLQDLKVSKKRNASDSFTFQ